ncbi:hypothetical protein Q7P35_006011 [Cladosporium inversicolor]
MVNKKKRGQPDVEDIIARPWCYYCERDFDDQKVLIQHQKAKHFKCDHCNRRLNTAGGLQVHLQQVHKATLTHIDNAMESRQNVEPEVFGMMGIPDELIEAHRQRILNVFFEEEANRRAQTGNPPPGQGQPNAKRQRTMETPEELKARLAEHRAKRAAERQAEKEGKVVKTSSSSSPDPAQARAAPSASDYMAPPPQVAYDFSHYTQPQQTPQFVMNNGLPMPLPQQSPHGAGLSPSFPVQQPGQWPSRMPPHSISPPQAGPYATPSFTPPVHSMQPAHSRPQVHYSGVPTVPVANVMRNSPAMSRAQALPQPAPGLPARPSFNPPSFNREDMQRMHTGQAPPQANIAGHPRPAAKPRKLSAHDQQVVEDVEQLLKEAKDNFKKQQASDAANAAQGAANEAASQAQAPVDAPADGPPPPDPAAAPLSGRGGRPFWSTITMTRAPSKKWPNGLVTTELVEVRELSLQLASSILLITLLLSSDFPRFSTYLRARNVTSPALFHALAGRCEENVDGLPGGREHDVYSFPSDASANVFPPAHQPPDSHFPRHETCDRVPEQLFVVLADGVGHRDGRDFGAHGVGRLRGCSGGDGKSLV